MKGKDESHDGRAVRAHLDDGCCDVDEARREAAFDRRAEARVLFNYLGPIRLPGFGFAYCSVSVSEFSGSHYCDRVSNVM